MPWRFSYKSLKFLPAAFSALHPVMQEPPWGASPGFVSLLSGYISSYINAFASPAGSRSCINVLLQFSVFTVSTAALLGRKGSFLLCGHSWFLCGCWCRAEVFSFYPCGIIYTQWEGKHLEYRTLCFMGVKCSVLSGSSFASCEVFSAVLSVSLLCLCYYLWAWCSWALKGSSELQFCWAERCCWHLWSITDSPKGFQPKGQGQGEHFFSVSLFFPCFLPQCLTKCRL